MAKCGECFKRFTDGSNIINYKDEKYHRECFVCVGCSKPFLDGYIEAEGKCWCENCANATCTICSKILAGKCCSIGDKKAHEACFKCDTCRQGLSGKQHFLLNKKYYCAEDYELENKSNEFYGDSKKNMTSEHDCALCGKGITVSEISYNGKFYHNYCLTCNFCNTSLSHVKEHKGRLCCQNCIDYMCSKCNKIIEDNFVTLDGKKFHKRCFACAVCGEVLDSSSFYKINSLPYCENHYKKESK